MRTDVIIVGSGFSGLSLSILLSRRGIDHIVLERVVKRRVLPLPKTIPPSALVLLDDLKLLELFSEGSSKTYGYQSIWKSSEIITRNFYDSNPFKYGLRLNEEVLLSGMCEEVSQHLLQVDRVLEVDVSDAGVVVEVESPGKGREELHGQIIVDASGRNRSVLKKLGIGSEMDIEQIALSCHLPYFKHPKLIHPSFIEYFDEGWGIVSPLNSQTNVMSLFFQKRSSVVTSLKQYENWGSVLDKTQLLKDFLTEGDDLEVFGAKADSSRASKLAGDRWLAIGDAAIAFDPLSSHGITNSLYCAKLASELISSRSDGSSDSAFGDYEDMMSEIYSEYCKQNNTFYA